MHFQRYLLLAALPLALSLPVDTITSSVTARGLDSQDVGSLETRVSRDAINSLEKKAGILDNSIAIEELSDRALSGRSGSAGDPADTLAALAKIMDSLNGGVNPVTDANKLVAILTQLNAILGNLKTVSPNTTGYVAILQAINTILLTIKSTLSLSYFSQDNVGPASLALDNAVGTITGLITATIGQLGNLNTASNLLTNAITAISTAIAKILATKPAVLGS